MSKITQEVAESLVADLIIEAEAGASSADALLARSSRGTLALAMVIELLLTGNAPEAGGVDTTLADAVTKLQDEHDALVNTVNDNAKSMDSVGDAVTAIDQRVTAVEAKYNVMEAANSDASAADADISNRLAAEGTTETANGNVAVATANNQPANADVASQANTGQDAADMTAARVDTPAL